MWTARDRGSARAADQHTRCSGALLITWARMPSPSSAIQPCERAKPEHRLEAGLPLLVVVLALGHHVPDPRRRHEHVAVAGRPPGPRDASAPRPGRRPSATSTWKSSNSRRSRSATPDAVTSMIMLFMVPASGPVRWRRDGRARARHPGARPPHPGRRGRRRSWRCCSRGLCSRSPTTASFFVTYPGDATRGPGTPVGFPAWLSWTHFLSAFFLLFIVRSGLLDPRQAAAAGVRDPSSAGRAPAQPAHLVAPRRRHPLGAQRTRVPGAAARVGAVEAAHPGVVGCGAERDLRRAAVPLARLAARTTAGRTTTRCSCCSTDSRCSSPGPVAVVVGLRLSPVWPKRLRTPDRAARRPVRAHRALADRRLLHRLHRRARRARAADRGAARTSTTCTPAATTRPGSARRSSRRRSSSRSSRRCCCGPALRRVWQSWRATT